MSAERAFSTPILIGPRATSDRVGAGHRLALNLNIHYHMLFLHGVYLDPNAGRC